MNVSLIDFDDDNQNEDDASQLNTAGNQSIQPNSVSCILDSMIPDILPIPLVPFQLASTTDAPALVGQPVPSTSQPKRSVPDLIPILNHAFKEKPKQYPGRRSNVAQFILESLQRYDNEVVDNGFDSSEDFGRLAYSGSESE